MPMNAAEAPLSKAEIVELLRRHRISPTQQRVEIAQIVLSKPQHLSADEVLALAHERGSRVSKATVYNTMGLFARVGLVREVIVDPTKVFYDSNVSEHHHFYNVDTGELMDIPAGAVELGALPDLPKGTQAAGVDVIIRVRSQ